MNHLEDRGQIRSFGSCVSYVDVLFILDVFADSFHELSAGGNTVGIEHCTFVNSLAALPGLVHTVLTLLSGAKSTCSLLVELSSWRDAVDCDKEKSLGSHYLSNTTVEVPTEYFTSILKIIYI